MLPTSASSFVMVDTAVTAQGTTVIGMLLVALVSRLFELLFASKLLEALQFAVITED